MSNKTMLHILLVLTFIYAGMGLMSYLMVALTQPWLVDIYASNRSIIPDEVYTAVQDMLEWPRGLFLTNALLYALEVVGAALMWNLRPSGLHCYALARLLLILVPLLFIGKGAMGIGNVMMAALFIVVYWMLLKQLGAFSNKDNDSNSMEMQQEQA